MYEYNCSGLVLLECETEFLMIADDTMDRHHALTDCCTNTVSDTLFFERVSCAHLYFDCSCTSIVVT